MLQTNPTCYVKYIFLLGALLCYSVFFQQYGSWISTGTLRSSQQTVAVLEARDPEAEKAKEETNEAKEEVVKAKQETKEATDLYLKARAEAEEAATEAVKAKEEAKRLRAQCQPFEDLTALKMNKPNRMDCEGFPVLVKNGTVSSDHQLYRAVHESQFPACAAGTWTYRPDLVVFPSEEHLKCLDREVQGNCHDPNSWLVGLCQ